MAVMVAERIPYRWKDKCSSLTKRESATSWVCINDQTGSQECCLVILLGPSIAWGVLIMSMYVAQLCRRIHLVSPMLISPRLQRSCPSSLPTLRCEMESSVTATPASRFLYRCQWDGRASCRYRPLNTIVSTIRILLRQLLHFRSRTIWAIPVTYQELLVLGFTTLLRSLWDQALKHSAHRLRAETYVIAIETTVISIRRVHVSKYSDIGIANSHTP
nr:hypothetical protein CFP56_30649 [Quercus suber]